MNRKQIKAEAKKVISIIWLYIFIAILIVNIATSASVAIIGLVAIPLQAGLFLFLKQALQEEKYDFANLIKPYKNINHAINIFVAVILISLITFGGLLLFVIPGIIWALQYSQTIKIMAEDENISISEAMRKSKELMNGYKMDLLIFRLSFIGHYLLVVITLGLWSFYLIPYLELAEANYYLHLTRKNVSAQNTNNNQQQNEYNAEFVDQNKLI